MDASPMRFGDATSLVEGAIYTVIKFDPYPDAYGNTGLCVAEVNDLPDSDIYDDAYKSSRFRPITERKTDISIFKAMLNPSKQEVSA